MLFDIRKHCEGCERLLIAPWHNPRQQPTEDDDRSEWVNESEFRGFCTDCLPAIQQAAQKAAQQVQQ